MTYILSKSMFSEVFAYGTQMETIEFKLYSTIFQQF